MTIEDFREAQRAQRELADLAGICSVCLEKPCQCDKYAEQAQKRWEARNWEAHTVDTDIQHIAHAMRKDRLWAWCTFWSLVGAIMGYMVGRFVLPAWVGG